MLNSARKTSAHLEFSSAKTLAAARLGPRSMAFRHSLKVAWIARRLAMELEKRGVEICADDVATQAVLHDIGRGDKHGDLHGWEGYQLLREMGYEKQARACLTHWLKGHTLEQALSESSLEHRSAIRQIYREFGHPEMDLVDKLVALADSLVAHDEPVTIEERFREARERYGDSPWLRTNEATTKRYLDEIERLLGTSVYKLLQIGEGRK